MIGMRRGLRAFFDSGLARLGRSDLGQASLALACLALAGCGGGGVGGAAASSASGPAAAGGATMSATAALGELIFHDVSLSASGRQACSSCHVAENGHAAANGLPAQLGGADLDLPGARNVPGIRYLASNTPPPARPSTTDRNVPGIRYLASNRAFRFRSEERRVGKECA